MGRSASWGRLRARVTTPANQAGLTLDLFRTMLGVRRLIVRDRPNGVVEVEIRLQAWTVLTFGALEARVRRVVGSIVEDYRGGYEVVVRVGVWRFT